MNERLKRELHKWAATGDDSNGPNPYLVGSGVVGGAAVGNIWNTLSNRSKLNRINREVRLHDMERRQFYGDDMRKHIQDRNAALMSEYKTKSAAWDAATKRMNARRMIGLTEISGKAKELSNAVRNLYGVGHPIFNSNTNPEIMGTYHDLVERGLTPKEAMRQARSYARQGRTGVGGNMVSQLSGQGLGRQVILPDERLTALERNIGSYKNRDALFNPEVIKADERLLYTTPKPIKPTFDRYQNINRFVPASYGHLSQLPKSRYFPAKAKFLGPRSGRMFKGLLRGGAKVGSSAVLGGLLAYLADAAASYALRGNQGL